MYKPKEGLRFLAFNSIIPIKLWAIHFTLNATTAQSVNTHRISQNCAVMKKKLTTKHVTSSFHCHCFSLFSAERKVVRLFGITLRVRILTTIHLYIYINDYSLV